MRGMVGMVGYAGFVVARAWVKSECAGAAREKRGRGAGVQGRGLLGVGPERDPGRVSRERVVF